MPPPHKAKWTVVNATQTVDASGTLRIGAVLRDNGTAIGRFDFTITAERVAELVVTSPEGADALAGFTAWMKRGDV